MATPSPRKPMPEPGEAWSVADAVFAIVAAGSVTVLDVDDDRVIFADDRGGVGAFTLGTFRGLYDPPQPAQEEPAP